MSDEGRPPSHRERIRAQTTAEIRRHAFNQLAQGGVDALSLNAIAKDMGMSGPALYRYYPSRDELLAALVTESYQDMADALETAAHRARHQPADQRLRAIADAYRHWANHHSHQYRLVYTSYGTGALDPDVIIPASQRSMQTLLAAIADVAAPTRRAARKTDPALDKQLVAWAQRNAATVTPPPTPQILLLGLLAWSRWNGLITLEIEGFYQQLEIDPTHLYTTEVDTLLTQAAQL